MSKSTVSVIQKRRPGRPATGQHPLVALRFAPEMIAAVDKWAKKQATSRSEAIRRLVELGLAAKTSHEPYSKKSTDRAAEMAERQIDRLSDPSATSEERQSRKRKLLKGPAEFRDMRKKPKR